MADRFNIALLGDKELSAKLAGMTEKLERKVLSQAFRKAALTIKADAERRVGSGSRSAVQLRGRQRGLPLTARQVGRLRRQGALVVGIRNSLRAQALKRRKGRVGYSVVTGTRAQLGITGRYYYPAHVEKGHGPPHRVRHGTNAAVRREFGSRRTPPHPFLRPALKQNEGALMSQIAEDIRTGIEREAPTP